MSDNYNRLVAQLKSDQSQFRHLEKEHAEKARFFSILAENCSSSLIGLEFASEKLRLQVENGDVTVHDGRLWLEV